MLRNLLALPRSDYEAYRDVLPHNPVMNVLFDFAREANSAVHSSRATLRALQEAEHHRITADNHLCEALENLATYLHDHVEQLDPRVYRMLAQGTTGNIPTATDFLAPTPVPRAQTPYYTPTAVSDEGGRSNPTSEEDVMPSPARRVTRSTARPVDGPNQSSTNNRSSGRRTRRDRRTARIAYPPTRRPEPRSGNSPNTSSRGSSPGFRGPYQNFLDSQEAYYGRDSDGEIRIIDRYSGESEQDHDVVYNEQDAES